MKLRFVMFLFAIVVSQLLAGCGENDVDSDGNNISASNSTTDCSTASNESECRERGCFPVSGKKLDDDCWIEQYAGCLKSGSCNDAVTYAFDLNNACWEFLTSCTPDDFQDTNSNPECDLSYFSPSFECN